MHPVETDVRLAWKLVAQFVSWDFCRYVCQQSDSNASETDVLTFLRNMFVERTERPMCEATEQELAAKFVLEARALGPSPSHLPRLGALARSLSAPLRPHALALIHRLEALSTVLEGGCAQPELVTLRMEDEVALFAKEADALLPPPELLKMIEPWAHRLKSRQKPVHNPLLFEQAVRCLRRESISPTEAKLITVAVCEDELLHSMVLQPDSETELDSEPFSLSFRSSQDYCPSSDKPPTHTGTPIGPGIGTPADSLDVGTPADSLGAATPPDSPNVGTQRKRDWQKPLETLDDSLHFTQDSGEFRVSAAAVEDVEEEQFALSSESSSSSSSGGEEEEEERAHESEVDTSDCDKDNTIRFLTPTFYREGGSSPPAMGVASQQSDVPSVDDARRDPTWCGPIAANRGRSQRRNPKKKKAEPRTRVTGRANQQSMEDIGPPSSKLVLGGRVERRSPRQKKVEPVDRVPVAPERKKKLFTGIQDYFGRDSPPSSRVDGQLEDIPEVAEEVVVTTTVALPAHRSSASPTQAKIVRRRRVTSSSGVKKCRQCAKSFKTQLALKRHLFLKHPDLED